MVHIDFVVPAQAATQGKRLRRFWCFALRPAPRQAVRRWELFAAPEVKCLLQPEVNLRALVIGHRCVGPEIGEEPFSLRAQGSSGRTSSAGRQSFVPRGDTTTGRFIRIG